MKHSLVVDKARDFYNQVEFQEIVMENNKQINWLTEK